MVSPILHPGFADQLPHLTSQKNGEILQDSYYWSNGIMSLHDDDSNPIFENDRDREDCTSPALSLWNFGMSVLLICSCTFTGNWVTLDLEWR